MDSDSIRKTTPIPSSKNLGKKKKINRSAKLKQNKIDARREQWLSQGSAKNKGRKDGVNDDSHMPPVPAAGKHSKRSLEQLETRHRGEEDDGSIHHQESDLESPSHSPTSNVSGTNFTGSSSGGSSRSSSSSSAGCCSGNITEEEREEEDCLDDWEAVADALAADEKQQQHHQNPCSESAVPPIVQNVSAEGSNSEAADSKPESVRLVPSTSQNTRAWRADDAYRPQSLPTLSKQLSMPNPNRLCGGGSPWTRCSAPSSCPICYEDLDLTDSSFLPCLCGFRLCLFCHKRILEEDGRCPGCRKPYDCEPVETEVKAAGGSYISRLARSCSLVERS